MARPAEGENLRSLRRVAPRPLPMQPQGVPFLTRHKASAQGVVRLDGRDHYLGPWPAGRKKPPTDVQTRYDALIAEWLAGGRRLPSTPRAVTVADLAAAFWKYAELHYRKPDGTPTNELNEYRVALRPVR